MADEEVSVKVKITGIADAMGDLRSFSKGVDEVVSGINRANFSGFTSGLNGITSGLSNFASAQKQAVSATDQLSKSASSVGQGFSAATPGVTSFGDKLTHIGGGIVGGVVSGLGNITGAAGKAASGLLDLGGKAAGAVIDGLGKVGSMAASAGKALLDVGVHAAKAGASIAAGFGSKSVQVFQDFEKEISAAGAVSGLAGKELEDFKKNASDLAQNLGAELPVSASKAASAITELTKAGFTAEQSLEAARGTAILSSAANLEMDKAASIVANTISQFGLKASDASKTVDILAKTANASAVDVGQLAETFKYAGPVAQAAGFSLEDVAKAAGVLGNAGIKASSAGTGLKAIISELASPGDKAAAAFTKLGFSTKDAAGNIKPLQTSLTELRAKFATLSASEQIDLAKMIVGKDHFSKLLAIVNTSDESFNQMSDAIDHAKGAADEMAVAMTDNLAGAVDNMQGKVETLQIKLGKALAPAATIAANALGQLAVKAMPLADALGPKITQSIDAITKSFFAFKASIGGGFEIGDSVTGLPATFSRLGTALSPVIKAVDEFIRTLQVVKNINAASSMDKLTDSAANAHPIINLVAKGAQGLADIISGASSFIFKYGDGLGQIASKALELYQAFSPLSVAFSTFEGFLTGGISGAADAFIGKIIGMGDALGVDLRPAITGVGNFIQTTLLPALSNIGTFITGTVLPAVQAFGGWLSTNLGPILTSMGNTFNTTVLPALNQFGTFISTTVVPKLQELGTWIGTNIVPLLEKFAGFIATTVVPVLGSIASFIMGTVIPALTEWWSIIATALAPVIERVASFIGSTLLPALSSIGSFITSTVIPALNQMWGFIQANILPILKEIATFIGGQLASAFDNFAATATTVWNVVSTVVSTAWNTISSIWNSLSSTLGGPLSGAFNTFKGVVSGVWDAVSGFISSSWNTISGIFNNISSAISGPLSSAFQAAQNTVSTVWTAITSAVSAAWSSVQGTFNSIVSFLNGTLASAWNSASSTVSSTWNTITSTISKAVSDIVSTVGKIPGQIGDALKAGVGEMISAGKALIQGLASGIASIKIPLPHVKVSFSNTQVGPLSIPVPDFRVDWYAKGGIFTQPTILSGLGDAGPEAALPLNSQTLGPLLKPIMTDSIMSVMRSMPATPSQIYNQQAMSNYDNSSVTKVYQLAMQTLQSSGNIASDFGMMETLSV